MKVKEEEGWGGRGVYRGWCSKSKSKKRGNSQREKKQKIITCRRCA